MFQFFLIKFLKLGLPGLKVFNKTCLSICSLVTFSKSSFWVNLLALLWCLIIRLHSGTGQPFSFALVL